MITGGTGPHAAQPVAEAGTALADAGGALILLHGRGGQATGMLGLGQAVAGPRTAILAPEAAGQTWYPYRFTEAASRNEPYLSSALSVVGDLVARLVAQGMAAERIALIGFSQGACLTLEFVSRRAGPLGAAIGLSGGLIGDSVSATGRPRHDGMPVFLGCSERDPHIPVERVRATADVFSALGAAVTTRIYPGSSHDVNEDELNEVMRLVAAL